MNDEERLRDALRAAADLDTREDWAERALRGASGQRRRAGVWRVVGGVAAAAAVVGVVTVVDPWGGSGTHVPGPAGVTDSGDGALATQTPPVTHDSDRTTDDEATTGREDSASDRTEATSAPTEAAPQPRRPEWIGLADLITLPEGATVVTRAVLEPEEMYACLLDADSPLDPTGPCPGVDIKTWHSYEAVGPRGLEGLTQGAGPLPCYADPQWIANLASGEPVTNPATIDPVPVDEGSIDDLEGRGALHWQRWQGHCADGSTFSPSEFWFEGRGFSAMQFNDTGAWDLPEILGGMIIANPSGSFIQTDAEAYDVQGDTLTVGLYAEGSGPVGAAGASPAETAEVTVLDEETQCFLHDLERGPGQGLGQVPCQELLDWLAETDEDRAYVTIITDPGSATTAHQVRTLSVPSG